MVVWLEEMIVEKVGKETAATKRQPMKAYETNEMKNLWL